MKKNDSIKNVLFNSGIYSFTSILQKGVQFLLLPLYTLYLTPRDYGITSIVISFTSILTLIATLSLNNAVQRFYFIYKKNIEELKRFLGTIYIVVFLNSLVLSFLIIIFQEWIITPFIDGVEFYPYLLMGILTVVFNPLYTIYQNLLQTMQNGKKYGINSLIHFGLVIILNVLFIIVLELGAFGQLLSNLIVAILFGVFAFIDLYRNDIIAINIDFEYLKQALSYSLPLLPHNLSSTIANFISRLFLNNQISTASAGLFNIASQFSLIVDTLLMSVNNAYIPWFYNEMDLTESKPKKVINFADFISKIYMFISVSLSFVIKEVIQIFLPEEYLISWILIPIMLIAFQFKSIYLFYVNTLFYNTKATRVVFLASVTGNLCSVIVSALLTTKIGLVTPAIATLVQWIVTSGIVIVLSQIIEPVDFKLSKMVGYVFLMAITIIVGQFYDFINPISEISILKLMYKFSILLIMFFILFHRELPFIRKTINRKI